MMVLLVTWALVILVPAYVVLRFRRSGGSGVFNLLLYPLVMSYFYLLVPSLITGDATLAVILRLSDASRDVVNALSAWYVLVFLGAYWWSQDPEWASRPQIRLRGLLRLGLVAAEIATAVAMSFVLVRHGPALMAIAGDRYTAYEYYASNVLEYPISVLFSFAVASGSALYLSSGRWLHLAPLFLFAALDLFHGGRGYITSVIVVVYVNVIAKDGAVFRKASLLAVSTAVVVFASAFVRRHVLVRASVDPVISFAGEFYYTRLTARYVYDHMTMPDGLASYLVGSLARMLPQSLVGPLVRQGSSFAVIINSEIDAGFGLAGSVLSEALYYGGIPFAVVSPLLMAALYWAAGHHRIVARLPGYIVFLLMASSMHVVFRSGFYPLYFSTLYTGYVYLGLFAFLGVKKKVFVAGPIEGGACAESPALECRGAARYGTASARAR